jgi:ParB-like chromosome segregation protein Spo0J
MKGIAEKIIEKKIEEVVPYENNPRNNDKAVKFVANSIKQFGFKVPIIIDKNGVIVAGHTRLKAAKKLGMKMVPCIVADDLTPEQVKAFRLADNKTAELADWNDELLESELADIDDIDMGQFGFGRAEFDSRKDSSPGQMGKLRSEDTKREVEKIRRKRG